MRHRRRKLAARATAALGTLRSRPTAKESAPSEPSAASAASAASEASAASPSPLAQFRSMLPAGTLRNVVVLTPADVAQSRVNLWLQDLRFECIHVVGPTSPVADEAATAEVRHHPAATTSDAHDALKPLGPVDVVLDLIPSTAAEYESRWHELFLHLRPQGVYIVRRPGRAPGFDAEVRRWTAGIVAALADEVVRRAPGEPTASSAAAVSISTKALVIVKRRKHRLKLRDAETNAVLPARDKSVRIDELESRPAGSFLATDTVIHHEADTPIDWPDRVIAYPELHLRHYSGQIGFAGHTLLFTRNSLLPEAFRWHLADNPSNPITQNSSRSFARVPKALIPQTTWSGDYYQLDPQHSGFGHVMTEVVSRLWGWDEAKRRNPDLKALFGVQYPKMATSTPKYKIMRAYGIPAEDIVWTSEPVYLNSLVSATAMWHNNKPYYVHPDIREAWHRLGESLIRDDVVTHERIFISRSDKYPRRQCRNQAEVEQFFVDNGFTIVYPEQLDMSEQASVFASARVIAGFAGSALFNLLHARKLETVVILNQDAYYHRNEHLFTSLLGCTVHYFWSTADIPQDETGQNLRASESAWEFDFARHANALRQVLQES